MRSLRRKSGPGRAVKSVHLGPRVALAHEAMFKFTSFVTGQLDTSLESSIIFKTAVAWLREIPGDRRSSAQDQAARKLVSLDDLFFFFSSLHDQIDQMHYSESKLVRIGYCSQRPY